MTWIILSTLAVILNTACSGTVSTPVSLPPTPTAALPAQAPTAAALPTLKAPSSPQAQTSTAAPDCAQASSLTPSITEGPYFKANSPERSSLLGPGISGTKLVLTGYVLTADCKPVAHALLDFWQANARGEYDNTGYTLRGHQYTDAAGRYQLETIVPGLYPGRTEHIHVKVQAPGGPMLTTQLFFPGVASNQRDGIFDQKLLMTVQDTGDGKAATFNFVVNPGNAK
jgi:protocatechuate 3,4-dioxygenase beta subunit